VYTPPLAIKLRQPTKRAAHANTLEVPA
jgi:hypothetical protein